MRPPHLNNGAYVRRLDGLLSVTGLRACVDGHGVGLITGLHCPLLSGLLVAWQRSAH